MEVFCDVFISSVASGSSQEYITKISSTHQPTTLSRERFHSVQIPRSHTSPDWSLEDHLSLFWMTPHDHRPFKPCNIPATGTDSITVHSAITPQSRSYSRWQVRNVAAEVLRDPLFCAPLTLFVQGLFNLAVVESRQDDDFLERRHLSFLLFTRITGKGADLAVFMWTICSETRGGSIANGFWDLSWGKMSEINWNDCTRGISHVNVEEKGCTLVA